MAERKAERRFLDLIWPQMALVLRTAQCLTHNSAEAADLAQDTMMKAFRASASLRDRSNVKAWLMTILRHTRIDDVRRDKDEVSLDQMEMEPARDDAISGTSPDDLGRDPDEVLNSLSDEEVIDALRELPKEIRWTLLLVDVEGTDQSDAALILDIPVGTVKSRLHRGRAMLHETLRQSRQSAVVAV